MCNTIYKPALKANRQLTLAVKLKICLWNKRVGHICNSIRRQNVEALDVKWDAAFEANC